MSNSLPNNLYSCEQTRELDRVAIAEHGISGIVLMKRAARASYEYAASRWPNNKAWIVLCGAGNNAGDGYIFAALAAQKKQQVVVYWVSDPESLKGDAYIAAQFAQQEGVEIKTFPSQGLDSQDCVIIDALLGTGLSGSVRKQYQKVIDWANNSQQPILSLDIPSGLCGDTGSVLGGTIKASATMTFIGCKLGLLTGRGPAMTGELVFDNLGVPSLAYEKIATLAKRIDLDQCKKALKPREADAHKGDFGHLMVIGGELGFGGAAIMAAEAALYSGAGVISLATRSEHVSPALMRCPELMAIGVCSGQELEPFLEKPSVLVVGPGLGLTPWSEQMLQQAFSAGLPMILDADALTIMGKGRLALPKKKDWVLTPHPGEAARMLGSTTEHVQKDRVAAIKALQDKYGGVVLLKGAGTLIYDGVTLILANVGNPGLATGGSGDVLSGVVGACMAQGINAFGAAQLGACLHGAAADQAVELVGERGLRASELIPHIRELMR